VFTAGTNVSTPTAVENAMASLANVMGRGVIMPGTGGGVFTLVAWHAVLGNMGAFTTTGNLPVVLVNSAGGGYNAVNPRYRLAIVGFTEGTAVAGFESFAPVLVPPRPLPAPSIRLAGSVVSWDEVARARGYSVRAGGNPVAGGELGSAARSVDLANLALAAGYQVITVVALGVTGENLNSPPSNGVSFVVAPRRFSSVSAGSMHTMAIGEGTLWAWGYSEDGRTGLGAGIVYVTSPVQVGAHADWALVSASAHTMAIRNDGTLWAWGRNDFGRTGLGTAIGYTMEPARVGTHSDWVYVSNSLSTIGIREDSNGNRTLWAWGSNGNGLTGLGTTAGNTLVPTRVGTGTNWASVSVGLTHAVAIGTDGTLWAWGSNEGGLTGLGTTAGNTLVPTRVGTETNWASVSVGSTHTVAIRTDGTLWAWGTHGHLIGVGVATGDVLVPTRVGADADWASVSADHHITVAIRTDGSLWAWGFNDVGEAGLGTIGNTITMPAMVGTGWAYVSTGGLHTAAIRVDGSLWAWGLNFYGMTGLGTTAGSTLVPTRVTVPTTARHDIALY